MRNMKWLVIPAIMVLIAGCSGNNNSSSVVSSQVPFLISAPSVTYKLNTGGTSTAYDITVTLQADGPTGVFDASLWIYDVPQTSNSRALNLTNISNTKIWSASTNTLFPLPPGQYYISNIVLNDVPSMIYPLRTGWYYINSMFSNDVYFVEESEVINPPFAYLFYNAGLSGISVSRFTLP